VSSERRHLGDGHHGLADGHQWQLDRIPWYWVEPPDAYPISIARDRKEISDGSDST